MTPRFFGYGSLVNLATHDYANPVPATLSGWRRVWRHTDLRPVAFLSVEPAPEMLIDGITAEVPNADWAALDAREFAYARRDVSHQVAHGSPAASVAVYEVETGKISQPSVAHPILLSYLDVVLQGFLRVHGTQSLPRFFETTAGWDAPVLNDRTAPRYPRHQTLSPSERAFIDAALVLAKVSVT